MATTTNMDFYKDPILSGFSFHNVSEAIFWCNFKGEFLYANDAASKMTGYTRQELVTMKVTDINTEIGAGFTDLWKKLKTEKQITLEAKHKNKKGFIYHVEIRSHYRIYQGEDIAVTFVKNIHERKLAEENLISANKKLEILLEESEGRYRDLFEEAPIAYVHEGLDSKFIKANRAALRILGVRPEEVVNTVGKTLVVDSPENQLRLKEAFDSIESGIDTSGVVLELRRKDNGQPIWIQWWSKPDISGKFTRTMFIDITDKVLMQREQENLRAENLYLQDEIKFTHNFEEIISKSKLFHQVLGQIEQVASTDATVLILGETGTGKELLARAVHSISKRNKRALIKINCANLPDNLIESELFGHERGAFTGAMDRKIGRFELADNGTIFLDEIGELPVKLQSKLLRVLQEGEFERLGNPKTIKVNVRVIAATNRNLEEAITKNEFREDLYYRLNVFQIVAPPLRKRKEDIPLLVKHFVKKYEGKMGREIKKIPDNVIDALMLYNWPGNIRELENKIERALILGSGDTLQYGDWIPKSGQAIRKGEGGPALLKMQDVEREHIMKVLDKANWIVSGDKGAAKLLGLNPNTLFSRMKKLGIHKFTKA